MGQPLFDKPISYNAMVELKLRFKHGFEIEEVENRLKRLRAVAKVADDCWRLEPLDAASNNRMRYVICVAAMDNRLSLKSFYENPFRLGQ